MQKTKLILKSCIRLLCIFIFIHLGNEVLNLIDKQLLVSISAEEKGYISSVFSAGYHFFTFVLMWITGFGVISFAGGWFELSRKYRSSINFSSRHTFPGTMTMNYAYCLPVIYRGIARLNTTSTGLEISVWPLFRLFHPRLWIPWSAIDTYKLSQKWGYGSLKLYIREIRITIHGDDDNQIFTTLPEKLDTQKY